MRTFVSAALLAVAVVSFTSVSFAGESGKKAVVKATAVEGSKPAKEVAVVHKSSTTKEATAADNAKKVSHTKVHKAHKAEKAAETPSSK